MNKNVVKFLLLFLSVFTNLFALDIVPLTNNLPPVIKNGGTNNQNSIKQNQSLLNDDYTNLEKNILYNGGPIIVYAGYQTPVDVRFPAYIEKIEYMEGKGGVYVYQRNFMNGTQVLRILRKKPSKIDNIIYVTVLGRKIPIIVKYPDKKHLPDHIVNVNIPKSLFNIPGINSNNSNGFSSPKVIKVVKYKNLSFKTNIESVIMILKMIDGTAGQYYQEVNLKYTPNKNNELMNFFETKNQTKAKYLALLFKKVFRGNKDFMTAYFNNEIIPQKLYIDNYVVYLTNRRKAQLRIYGVKTKWCNLSKRFYKEITIDDVKLVFGKDILAAYHPFRKIPPGHCAEVYAVFYSLPNNNINSIPEN